MGFFKSMGRSIRRQLGKAGIGRSDGERRRSKAKTAAEAKQWVENQKDVSIINGVQYYKNVKIEGGTLGTTASGDLYDSKTGKKNPVVAPTQNHSGLDAAMKTWNEAEGKRKGARNILANTRQKGKDVAAAKTQASSTAGAVSTLLKSKPMGRGGASGLLTPPSGKQRAGGGQPRRSGGLTR